MKGDYTVVGDMVVERLVHQTWGSRAKAGRGGDPGNEVDCARGMTKL